MAKLHRDQLHSDALVLIEIFKERAAPSEVISMMESVMMALITLRIRLLQGKASDRLQLRPYDSTGKFCGFESLFRQLEVARLNLNKEDFNLAGEKVFGFAHMSFAVIAADLGLLGWKKYYKRVEEKQLQSPRAEITFGGRALWVTGDKKYEVIIASFDKGMKKAKIYWEIEESNYTSLGRWVPISDLEAIPDAYDETIAAAESAVHHSNEALELSIEAQALKNAAWTDSSPDLGEAWIIEIFGKREPGIYLGDKHWKIYDGTAVNPHVIGKLTLQDQVEIKTTSVSGASYVQARV